MYPASSSVSPASHAGTFFSSLSCVRGVRPALESPSSYRYPVISSCRFLACGARGVGGLPLAGASLSFTLRRRPLSITLRCARSTSRPAYPRHTQPHIPLSIRPRKMPSRPRGLNAGVAHAECDVCCLRGIVSRMWFLYVY